MERLTFMNGDDVWCVDNENCFEEQSENYCGPAIDRLAYYEGLEEQGRLVVLPCKVGEGVKQYCRYCVHLFTGNGIWCEEKKVEMRETTAKSVNHCDSFEFCGMDAFFETNGYKPRGKRTPTIDEIGENQLRMEEYT